VLLEKLPDIVRESIDAYVGCVAGASLKTDYLKFIRDAGFRNVEVSSEKSFPAEFLMNDPTVKQIVEALNASVEDLRRVAQTIVSIVVVANKQ
jgi:hypothetical protein